jgi:hypothetical protein
MTAFKYANPEQYAQKTIINNIYLARFASIASSIYVILTHIINCLTT